MEENYDEYIAKLRSEHPEWDQKTIDGFVQIEKSHRAFEKLKAACSDGTGNHQFENVSTWNDSCNEWFDKVVCKKCGLKWGTAFEGCKSNYDRKHNFVEDTIEKDGIRTFSKECTSCGTGRTTMTTINQTN